MINFLGIIYLFVSLVFLYSQEEQQRIKKLKNYCENLDSDKLIIYADELNIDETTQKYVSYLSVQSSNNYQTDPIIFWLNGGVSGPGCSSFIAFSKGVGPCNFDDNLVDEKGQQGIWQSNQFAFHEKATLVFLELPINVGFSTQNIDIKQYDPLEIAEDASRAVLKWLDVFQDKFKNNKIYLVGEGWGGTILPKTANILYGYSKIVSGLIFLNAEIDARLDFLWGYQMYNIEIRKIIENACVRDFSSPSCQFAISTVNSLTKDVNLFDIFSECKDNEEISKRISFLSCVDYSVLQTYFNSGNVKLELNKTTSSPYNLCNEEIQSNFIPYSSKKELQLALKNGIDTLFINGNQDAVYPLTEIFSWAKTLFSINNWRQYFIDQNLVGHTITYAPSLTIASIRGAGGNPYIKKGKEVKHIIYNFLNEKYPDSTDFKKPIQSDKILYAEQSQLFNKKSDL